jgi:CheY-like chemotaxis protein
LKILIVEDEALLALGLESEVEAGGHRVVGVATDMPEALALVDLEKPDFAFVDIHLRDGPTGVDVGRYVASMNIPYVFVSGNLKRIPDDFAGALGAIEKPYTMHGLKNALSYIEAVLSGMERLHPPSSLVTKLRR